MLQRQHGAVFAVGSLVLLRVAGAGFALEFPDALALSVKVRHSARLAKLSTGNKDRGYYCAGVLSAVGDSVKPSRSSLRVPELLAARSIHVGELGHLVTITIKGTTMEMDYPSARSLAQWLRVRGREAMRNAGETGHWSQFAQPTVPVNG